MKNLIALALLLCSISITSCSGTHGNSSQTNNTQNLNIKITESSNGWEFLESVEAASLMNDKAKQDICPPTSAAALLSIMYVYVRVVAGEKYIGVSKGPNSNPKIASPNPYYNDSHSSWGKYQYRVKYYDGEYYYFNL